MGKLGSVSRTSLRRLLPPVIARFPLGEIGTKPDFPNRVKAAS